MSKKGVSPRGLPKLFNVQRETVIKSNLPEGRVKIGSEAWKEGMLNKQFSRRDKPKNTILGRLFGTGMKREKPKQPEAADIFKGKPYVATERVREKVKKDIGGKIPGEKGLKTRKKRLKAFEPFEEKTHLSRKNVKDILTKLDKERKDLIRQGKSLGSKEMIRRRKQLKFLKKITGETPRKF